MEGRFTMQPPSRKRAAAQAGGGAKPGESPAGPDQPDEWRFHWPNTADFNFNYYKLLESASESSIAENTKRNTKCDVRIAIVGAGVAGLVAARELFRCGYTKIDIYEASDRIGGRTYSKRLDGQHTTMEMGAMRMPFFGPVGSGNCVLDYYRKIFKIQTQEFPNPGATAADTGVWVNGGYGPDIDKPADTRTLLIWRKADRKPPDDDLRAVFNKWDRFASQFQRVAKEKYAQSPAVWVDFWHAFVQHYWAMSFRDFVFQERAIYSEAKPGYFGGLDMTQKQANLFYVIGAGDGGWGAFYDISCLFPIRTLLCGYGSGHQLIQGKFGPDGNHAPGPRPDSRPTDSLGYSLQRPEYLGVQSFAECLFYEPVTSGVVDSDSLYDAIQSTAYDLNLYTRTAVEKIIYLGGGKVCVESGIRSNDYDAVVITPSTWALQMSIDFEGFPADTMPLDVQAAVAMSHWITSCKVFFPLTRRFWEEHTSSGEPFIPQTLVTDTFVQGVYGYGVTTKAFADPGVLLASYTWEDDANKLLASESNEALAERCLSKLDDILMPTRNRAISPYVSRDQPSVIHWAKMPTYRGCSKLTRSRSWEHDYTLLRYNQEHSADSHVYYAGEAYSVEGGWTEPAMRMAIDAVIHIAKNTGAIFLNGFKYGSYPRYSKWCPK
jgi:tryptophan 2-monooxygenase